MNDRAERTDRAAELADRREERGEERERRCCGFRDPVCIHTEQVYDSCRDRDCLRDARVYFTNTGQEIINRSINVKIKSAEIMWIYTTVEPVPFNRGFYTVDIKYFIRVTVEAFRGVSCPVEVNGLTTFDKKIILFGSEGNSKVFRSGENCCEDIETLGQQSNMPRAIVEVVDPIALSAKTVTRDECCCCDCNCNENFLAIPENICACFDDELYIGDDGKLVLATLGLFTVVRLERSVELLINAIDFCIPDKECSAATEKNPCELFSTIRFPLDEFYPPQKGCAAEGITPVNAGDCGCGCGCGCNGNGF